MSTFKANNFFFGKVEKFSILEIHCRVRTKKVVTFERRGGPCISFIHQKIPRHKIQSYTYNPTRVAKTCNARGTFVNCALKALSVYLKNKLFEIK